MLKYVVFKIVFVGSILEISNLKELLIWMGWFSVLGFLKMFLILARERFEYVRKCSLHITLYGMLVQQCARKF